MPSPEASRGEWRRNSKAWWWVWLAAVTVLAGGLRLTNLGHGSLWIDEAYTVQTCIDLSRTHRTKVLGYLPAWASLRLSGVDVAGLDRDDASGWRDAGVTERSARLGSAVIGILSIPILVLASRSLIGAGPAAVLGLLLAVAPWHIYWSQAARFYSVQFLFFGLSLAYYFTATRRGSLGRFAAAMACMVAAFLTQPTALVILPIFAADWVISRVRGWPVRLAPAAWAIGGVTVALCLLLLALDVRETREEWLKFVGSQAPRVYLPPHKLAMGTVYIVGPVLMAAALFSAWWMGERRGRLAVYLVLAGALPVLLFSAWSNWNAVGSRYLFVSLYAWLALAAVGVFRVGALLGGATGSRLLAAAPLALAVAAPFDMLYAYYTSAHAFHPRWREAYELILRESEPKDTICCRHPLVGQFYLRGRRHVTYLPDSPEELRGLGGGTWLAVQSEGTGAGEIRPWMYDQADLKRAFDLRVLQPVALVEVFLYRGAAADGGDGVADPAVDPG